MYINQISQENMLKITSIILCTYRNNKRKSATCFFCRKNDGKIILITNKHVFENAKTADLFLSINNLSNNAYENRHINLILGNDIKYHEYYDVATLNFTHIYNELTRQGLQPYIAYINEIGILTDYNNTDLIQEIIMVGYPDGIVDFSANIPIIRTGITATPLKNKYNNKDIFLTDIPTFGGSSGSPILITNKDGDIYLIGINAETYQHKNLVYNKKMRCGHKQIIGYADIPNDIGIAVNSLIIKDMLERH